MCTKVCFGHLIYLTLVVCHYSTLADKKSCLFIITDNESIGVYAKFKVKV